MSIIKGMAYPVMFMGIYKHVEKESNNKKGKLLLGSHVKSQPQRGTWKYTMVGSSNIKDAL
jgi:hypothetical protein